MIPVEKLEALVRRQSELDQLLCEPEILADSRRLQELTRERSHTLEVVDAFGRWRTLQKQIEEDKEALSDPELGPLAEEELPELEREVSVIEHAIQVLLLPRDPLDEKNTILEIRSGTGGEEAALFAADLFRMYARYAEGQRWSIEVLNTSEATAGGLKEVIAMVKGDRVFSRLKFEGGVHRVQRVPATETQGRVHTSTATVAVLPEAEDVEIHLDDKDLHFDIAASGGPGGQGVNTTNSAVQVTHLPTGMIVKCQDERSQIKNKARALSVLKARLFDLEQRKRDEEIRDERRTMVGGADRSEKIRTYNFPQNRVTDHRIGLTLHKLDKVIEGDLDEIVRAVVAHYEAERLKGPEAS